MYKRNAQGWSRHLDFIILDQICLQLALIAGVLLRTKAFAYAIPIYRNLALIMLLINTVMLLTRDAMHNVVSRGYLKELISTLKHTLYIYGFVTLYLFAMQYGEAYSRIAVFLSLIIYPILSYTVRILWKLHLKSHDRNWAKSAMLVVASPDTAEKILTRLSTGTVRNYQIVGVILTEDTDAQEICGYPVVARFKDAADYICKDWIDSVYIDAPLSDEKIIKLMDVCTQMAVPTHYHVPNMSRNGVKRFSEKVGGTTVLTTSISYVTPLEMLIKRTGDIFLGLIGSLFAVLIIAIVAPIIKLQSPGPVLFTQERIGKNGKRFKMYKIRSMHMDAEERKKELMSENRVKDGMMFKLDFDPRVIGNEILPDGTRKTGIGEFLRKTSLDEFPQFFCVLKGTMSIIGTRPPTIDEYVKYQYHHRARIAIKPGITGMWQVSGRSEITDFEEIVRLDTEYITNWSMSLDLKILFKTVIITLTGKGAM